jgi:hypothetical protein
MTNRSYPARAARTALLGAVLSAPLLLTACGEGYDMERIKGVVPYTLERTAGTGVAYVRAKMLPEKELVVAPVETKAEAPAAPPAPAAVSAPEEKIKDMEPMFHDKQVK